MGNSRSTLKHERLAEESDANYFKKVERRNRVKTRDMTFNPSNATKKGRRSTKPSSVSKSRKNINSEANHTLMSKEKVKVSDNPEIAATSVRYRSDMFRQAEEKPYTSTNGITASLSLKSSNFSPSPEKSVRRTLSGDKKSAAANSTNRVIAPLPLPSPPGSSNMLNKTAIETKRKIKAAEENKQFDESVKSGGILQKEISRSGRVTAVSWSPSLEGMLIAIGTDDGFVAIIDTNANSSDGWGFSDNSNTPLREFPREGKIRSLSWSADGSLLAIGGDDCTATIVDTTLMKIVHEFEREDRVYEVSFSPDMEFLAIGGFDGMIVIVSTDSYEVIVEIPMQGLVLSLCWSPDTSLLAVSTSDKCITVFDCDSWDILSELELATSIDKIRWSPRGKMIALGGQDGSTFIVNAENGKIIQNITKSNCRICAVCWNGDGSFLCIGGSDKISSIYETQTFEMVHEIRRAGSVLCSDWKSTGFLAIGGDDRMVAVLKSGPSDLHQSGKISQDHLVQSQANTIEKISDNKNTVTSEVDDINHDSFLMGQKNNVSFPTDLVNNNPFQSEQVDDITFSTDQVNNIDFSTEPVDVSFPNSWNEINSYPLQKERNEATAIIKPPKIDKVSNEVNEVTPFKDVHQLNTNLVEDKQFEEVIPKVTESEQSHVKTSINVVTISTDVYYMASGGSDGGVLIYSTDTWDVVMDMDFPSPIRSLLWSNSSEFLIIFTEGKSNNNVYVAQIGEPEWDIVAELSVSASPYSSGWSLADQMLAIGSSDGTLTFAETSQHHPSSWSIKKIVKAANESITAIDWSKNGKFLAVGCDDSGCIIYDSDALIENSSLQVVTNIRRKASISSVAFGAGGNFLAVGGLDSKIAIYRAKGEWSICHEVQFDSTITTIKWSVDGRYLAAGTIENSKSYHVLDTITWENVDVSEEHFDLETPLEYTASLDWSDDGKWLVIGGNAGNTRVIDVELMEVAYLIERGDGSSVESNDIEQDDKDEHESDYEDDGTDSHNFDQIPDGNTSVANMSDANSILEDLASVATPKVTRKATTPTSKLFVKRWTHRDEHQLFLDIVDEFLSPYEYNDPPQILRVFVACTLMLQWHVKWLDSHAMIVDVLSLQDDGKPMNALCDILLTANSLMEEIIRRDENIHHWWSSTEKFGLTNKDIKHLTKWNSWWEQVDVDASLVDCNLLCRLDQEFSSKS